MQLYAESESLQEELEKLQADIVRTKSAKSTRLGEYACEKEPQLF